MHTEVKAHVWEKHMGGRVLFCAEVMSMVKDAMPLYSKIKAPDNRSKDANKWVSPTTK